MKSNQIHFVKARPPKDTIEKFIRQASISGAIWRPHEIASMSGLVMKKPILDIGCGDGSFVKIVFNGKIDYGLDIQKKSLSKAKRRGIYTHLYNSSAQDIPLANNSIQTVFSNSVFEHIKNMDQVLAEVRRVLKLNGVLIFTTHAPASKDFYIARSLREMHINFLADFYESIFVSKLQLNTLWSAKTWAEKLASHGFKILEIRTIISPKAAFLYEIFQPVTFIQNRFPLLKKIPITYLVVSLFKINYFSKNPKGRNFFIRARKVS